MKYKALIADVDGTLVINKRDALPTKKVRDTITKAKNKIHIGVATSRSTTDLQYLFDHLELFGLSIISGGSQIYDSYKKQIVWEQPVNQEDFASIVPILENFSVPFIVQDDQQLIDYTKGYVPKKFIGLFSVNVNQRILEPLLEELQKIPTISIAQFPSWGSGKIGIGINHASATKQHGIWEIAKLLGISTEEIIGVGDGPNDFPLLMACGLKIAMGNAVPDLKAIADYVAPSVDEDGLAHVIEKFVL